MRQRAYLLTFLAYLTMHSLRTAYSFSKTYFKVEYNFSKLYLAFLDSSIYLAMGIGIFLRYFFLNKKDIISTFFFTGCTYIAAFILFPLLSLTDVLNQANAPVICIILMIVYGFFQMNCWAVSFVVMTDYFTNEEDGTAIGFWTTSGSFGNLLGFVIPPFFILTLHQPWQVPCLILSAVLLAATVGVYLFVKRKDQVKAIEYLQLESNQKEEVGFTELLAVFAETFSNLDHALLLISSCIYKAIIYTFVLWLPILVDSVGQKDQSAYVSVIMNISSIIGASFMGKFYEKSSSYISLQYLNSILAFILIIGLIVLIELKAYSFFIYAIIIFFEGFITGGIFNIMTGNQVIVVAGTDSVKVDLYTTAVYAASTFSVGIAQLMVGGFLVGDEVKQGESESYMGVFTVLLILATLAFIATSIRSYVIIKRSGASTANSSN